MLDVQFTGRGTQGRRPPWASPPSQGLCSKPCLNHPDKEKDELPGTGPGPSGRSSQLPLESTDLGVGHTFFQTEPAVDATGIKAQWLCTGREASSPAPPQHNRAGVPDLLHRWHTYYVLRTTLGMLHT